MEGPACRTDLGVGWWESARDRLTHLTKGSRKPEGIWKDRVVLSFFCNIVIPVIEGNSFLQRDSEHILKAEKNFSPISF